MENKSTGYMTKFLIQSISAHPDFSSTSLTMDALSTGAEEIVLDNTQNIGTDVVKSVLDVPYTNQTIVYNLVTSYTSDIYFQTQDQSFSVVEKNNLQVTPDLSWSSSGSTSVTFSTGNYMTSSVPSWIVINSTTGVVNIDAPDLNIDTEYDFYINSYISGYADPVQKLIKLTVINWGVLNWYKWAQNDSTVCQIWDSGYYLQSGLCTQASKTAKALSTTTQAIVGFSSWVSVISGTMNSASASSFWSLMNQFQLLFLLLLTRSHILDDVSEIIISQEYAINFPSLFHFQDTSLYDSVLNEVKFEVDDQAYNLLDIKSESIIYNASPMIIILSFVILIHLLIIWLK